MIGVFGSAVLFVAAGARYPGGYGWVDQTVSSLFQPLTADGVANAARPLAVASVILFCASGALAFARIATQAKSTVHRKTIQIAGIGSMVYAALTVTPMHDLLVGISVLFFGTAMLATFHMLWTKDRRWMVLIGAVCLSGTLGNAAMYYGGFSIGHIPIVQKLSLLGWVVWLLALSHDESVRDADALVTS